MGVKKPRNLHAKGRRGRRGETKITLYRELRPQRGLLYYVVLATVDDEVVGKMRGLVEELHVLYYVVVGVSVRMRSSTTFIPSTSA